MSWWADRWRSACDAGLVEVNPQFAGGVSLASKGRVSVTHVEPGLVRAVVRDRRDYRVEIGVQQLPQTEFGEVATSLARDPMLCAAVLTGELPIEVDAILLERGVSLLPQNNEVLAECDCAEYHSPCRHSVAVLLAMAELLGDDPFILTLLRGAGRDQIVAQVRDIRGLSQAVDQSDEPRGPDPGMAAAAAYRRVPTAPVAASLPPRTAVRPAGLTPQPPLDSGVLAHDLEALVFDASQRAVLLLRGEGDGSLRSSIEADLARRAAAVIAAGTSLAGLSEAAGVDQVELAEQARCWNIGGTAALAIRTERWAPDRTLLEGAQQLFDPPGRASGNTVSSGSFQLRLDQDLRWWRFVAHQTQGWLLDSGGFTDPRDALDDQL